MLAAHNPDEAIPDGLREEIAAEALAYYDNDYTRLRAAWEGTGFQPNPNLAANVRPKPTGIQLLRYLERMDKAKKQSNEGATQ
jgi:hypothetical protein